MSAAKFVLVKGRAGLGNRILCTTTGILYARLSGRRLLVDWSDGAYGKRGSNVFHRYFQSPVCDPSDTIPATNSVNPSIWQGCLQESAFELAASHGKPRGGGVWRQYSIDLTRMDYPEEVVVFWAFDTQVNLMRPHFPLLMPQFKGASTTLILRTILRDDLVLQPQIRERVEAFARAHFSGPMVGVHVRYSDYQSHLLGSIGLVDRLLQQHPDLKVFLATDNIQVKQLFEESYPGTVTTPHWYPRSGLQLHGNKSCPDKVENGVEALVDLYLLARCDYLVVDSSSSFGRLAQLLTDAPSTQSFDVKRGPKGNRRLVSLRWGLLVQLGCFDWGLWTLRQAIRWRKRQQRRLHPASSDS
jgi:hypothetical protein